MNNAKSKLTRGFCLLPITVLFLSSSFMSLAQAETLTTKSAHEHKQVVEGSHEMKNSMNTGMEEMQKMEMSGNVDKDFAMMMKIHHQQALDMAKVEIANGKSPAMKAMAKRIIAAQKKEIAQFDQWLSKQK